MKQISIGLLIVISSVWLILNCGDGTTEPTNGENGPDPGELVVQANEKFGEGVRHLRDLDIDDFDEIGQTDSIMVFQEAHDLYLQALGEDPNHLDANLGAAVTELIMLKNDSELRQMRDQWIDYVNSEPAFFEGVEFSLLKVSPPMDHSDLTLDEKSFSGELLNTSKLVLLNPPLASEMQQVVNNKVIPAIEKSMARVQKIVPNSNYTFTVSSHMQGGTDANPEEPVELDITDFKAFYAALYGSRAGTRIFMAWNLDVASYDSTDLVSAFQQSSDFLTLKSGQEMQNAKADLIQVGNIILEAIAHLRAETDDQDDDFITVDPGQEDDLDEIEDRTNQALTSLNGQVTLTEDFDDDPQTPDADLTISLQTFFDNPPPRPKELLPGYMIESDPEEGDEFVWTAQTFNAWQFPDPTFNGLLPGMTDTQLKDVFGMTFVPGDIDLTVGSGTTPEYSWNDSPIYSLTVINPSGTFGYEVVWQIRNENFENSILSPVTHGVVPPTAVQTDSSELVLTPGQLYRVEILRFGEGHIVDSESESRDFIP